MKTLSEALIELKVAQKRVREARRNFMRAYAMSLDRNMIRMEQLPITYSQAEDGLPKKMVEQEDWD